MWLTDNFFPNNRRKHPRKKLTIDDLKEICLENLGEGWIVCDQNSLIVFFFHEPGIETTGNEIRWVSPFISIQSPLVSLYVVEKWWEGEWTNSKVKVERCG